MVPVVFFSFLLLLSCRFSEETSVEDSGVVHCTHSLVRLLPLHLSVAVDPLSHVFPAQPDFYPNSLIHSSVCTQNTAFRAHRTPEPVVILTPFGRPEIGIAVRFHFGCTVRYPRYGADFFYIRFSTDKALRETVLYHPNQLHPNRKESGW